MTSGHGYVASASAGSQPTYRVIDGVPSVHFDSSSSGFAMSYDVLDGAGNDELRVSLARSTPGRFALDIVTDDGSFSANQWSIVVLGWHERTGFTFPIRAAPASAVATGRQNWGVKHVTYRAAAKVLGDSGYPAILSATGWDDDLVTVIFDSASSGKANLLINPVALP